LRKKLEASSQEVDALRKKIVATKEGGMITGEERFREFLADLYGAVTQYEGQPSRIQSERADALSRELGDVSKDFDEWSAKNLPSINAALAKKKLDPITPIARSDWEKNSGGTPSSTATLNRFERD